MNAPTNLTVVAQGEGAFFAWVDNSTDESGYMFEVYSKQHKQWEAVTVLPVDAISFNWSNYNLNGPQKFRVRAFQGVLGTPLTYSDPSNEVSYTG